MAWPTKGYSSLAALIGEQPGLAIFRRFATLNAQNLLYLQSELSLLEDELKDIVAADAASKDDKRRAYQFDLSELRGGAGEDEDGVEGMSPGPGEAGYEGAIGKTPARGKQWRKAMEIRRKLKEYNEALLQHAQLYALPGPNQHDLNIFRRWYRDEDHGAMFMPLPEGGAWDEDVTDLVALSARRTEGDVFTRWVTEKVVPRAHRWVWYRLKKPTADALYSYSDARFNSFANTLTLVLSSLFPPASIYILYFIEDTVVRLAVIMVFQAVFTACLAVFTSAKRIEIFAATVALASVQVVFVGTNGQDVPRNK